MHLVRNWNFKTANCNPLIFSFHAMCLHNFVCLTSLEHNIVMICVIMFYVGRKNIIECWRERKGSYPRKKSGIQLGFQSGDLQNGYTHTPLYDQDMAENTAGPCGSLS